MSLSVNRLGVYEPFLSDLLYTEVLLALQDRKDAYAAARELTNSIIRNLTREEGAEFSTHQISQATAKVLKRFNRRAHQRYAAEHPSLQS